MLPKAWKFMADLKLFLSQMDFKAFVSGSENGAVPWYSSSHAGNWPLFQATAKFRFMSTPLLYLSLQVGRLFLRITGFDGDCSFSM
eukprot:CAMPEP_0115313244 /NCGR_PEP_ID=MMETSP0270-20121206/76361_1 /TAXON_ID=71861 /ORGANISM="Scrippsiella trochoidea, Strain CCMP3099" /LENGTH=85 /DNA_ID=CAMNT_0002732321 /DNA_START=65 /DNA_END=319 /DNA_ORIENTATION=-